MKYKVVGWLDLVFGSLGFVQQVIMLLVVYPKMNTLYQDFGVDLPIMSRMFPYATGGVILVLAGIGFVGGKLAFSKTPSEKIYVLGILALISILMGMGYYSSLIMKSLITPMYEVSAVL